MTSLLRSGDVTDTDHDHRALRAAATRVLLGNWNGRGTVPSRSLYPHQWSWDSAFVAIGLRHLSPRRAQQELEWLLSAQWADGRVPHIVFNPAVPAGAYFPSPDFWQSSSAGRHRGAPAHAETSGIVQPPVHAIAAWLVHRADPRESARRGFLPRVAARLDAWHRYLADHRDLGGRGLAAILHPWEPGLDNSPCWDIPLGRVTPAAEDSYRRVDLDHSAAGDRPTDLDYARYVRLARDYRDSGYDDAAPHAFQVEDPGFNALLVAAEQALAEILRAVGADPAPALRRAERLATVLTERLWDDERRIFAPRDLHDDRLLPVAGVNGLLPLAVPGLPRPFADALESTATGERFQLGQVHMVPSYDLTSEQFDPNRYWRGPSWFNTAWLVHRGLHASGSTDAADELRAGILRDAWTSGFAEYVNPRTGAARGIRDFSWTAAVVLDLLSDPREER
ncbi:MGH1-like glycoside hydrolase domain-containing protein [Streptomyces sp. CA2R106]|uniref:MGH1-like glycoside hydrolase domain-containing protein n=1 Tax=Streptomyces sp. CA2R106 TaxID=3120153 RepID=UPI00300A7DC1